jgi:hypothetical protein
VTDTVAVIGAPGAGVTAVAAALDGRIAGCAVVEPAGLRRGQFPDAVVFVATAAAPMSPCDAALFAETVARTDAVVAAVTKIDVHRSWRSVLETNRNLLQPARCRPVPWVGVAADAEIGPRVIAPLIDVLRAELDDQARRRRNLLRARQWTLQHQIAERRREADRLAKLRARAACRDAGLVRIRQARMQLAHEARARSAALRADLHREAAAVSRRGLESYAARVHLMAQQVAEEFDAAVARRMAEVGAAPAPAPSSRAADPLPPPRRTALEDRLAVVFGSGFGLGVALTLGRFLAEAVPTATPAVVAVCGAAGLGLTGWVVRTRRLMSARAAMERWATEVAVGVRAGLEERALAAEAALLAAHTDTAVSPGPGRRARADRALEGWIAELAQVRAELGENPD